MKSTRLSNRVCDKTRLISVQSLVGQTDRIRASSAKCLCVLVQQPCVTHSCGEGQRAPDFGPQHMSTIFSQDNERWHERLKHTVPSLVLLGFLFVFRFLFSPRCDSEPHCVPRRETNDDASFGSLQQETRPFSNECSLISFVHIFASEQPPFGSETERTRSEKNSLCEYESCCFFFLLKKLWQGRLLGVTSVHTAYVLISGFPFLFSGVY